MEWIAWLFAAWGLGFAVRERLRRRRLEAAVAAFESSLAAWQSASRHGAPNEPERLREFIAAANNLRREVPEFDLEPLIAKAIRRLG